MLAMSRFLLAERDKWQLTDVETKDIIIVLECMMAELLVVVVVEEQRLA